MHEAKTDRIEKRNDSTIIVSVLLSQQLKDELDKNQQKFARLE